MDEREKPKSGCRSGCLWCLVLAGGLAYGGHWLWKNRRDDVLKWKDKAVAWCLELLQNTGDGGGSNAAPPPVRAFQWVENDAPQHPRFASLPAPENLSLRNNGAEWWKKGENWTRTKMEDYDQLTEADKELILSWDERKPEMARMIGTVRERLVRIASAPAYAYDRKGFEWVQEDVEVLAHCLDIGDPLRLADRLPAMQSHVRAFMSSVRWRVGISHPTAPHVHSGAKENSWEPDDGYVFTSSSDNNLSVIYRGHAYRCGRCNGSGTVAEMIRCPKCQGKGKVPNPLVQGANFASAALEIANAFSKHPKPVRTQQINDPGIRCDVCGGHGTIRQAQACPDCENGTVWR